MSRRTPLSALLAELQSQRQVAVTGARGGFAALLAASLSRELSRPLVLVTPTRGRARELADGLAFFLPASEPPALFVQPDTSPYQPITPNRAVELERVVTLYRLASKAARIVVTTARALAERVMPRSALLEHAVVVKPGDQIDREALAGRLDAAGYARVPVVEDPGTYAVRGGIVDVFSPVHDRPVRIDLFGDDVESLRAFDPESQRGRKRLEQLVACPVREVLINEETLPRARKQLRIEAAELGIPAQQVRAILAELDEGVHPLGVEGWLPAFYEQLDTLAALVPDDALWMAEDPALVEAAVVEQAEDAESHFTEARAKGRMVYPPAALYHEPTLAPHVRLLGLAYEEEIQAADTHIELTVGDQDDLRRAVGQTRGDDHAFEPVAQAIRDWRRRDLAVVALGVSTGHAERLRGLLSHYDLRAEVWDGEFSLDRLEHVRSAGLDVNLFEGSLRHGFVFEPLGLAVIGAEDILPHRQRVQRKSQARAKAAATLRSFQDLAPGALVVHTDHGIGRYEGLFKLDVDGVAGDFLKLSYRGDDLLYVPVHKLDRVQRYTAGEDASPLLDKLGGIGWEKAKTKAKKSAESMARELLKVAAARQARHREPYAPEDEYFEEFTAAFPWDETPDQEKAIDEVMRDMDAERPMDRLVCGDVGYGKTEVAMRAAMRAVLDRKQVGVLVPTTVLAEQHRLTFEDRFRGYPVSIAALSRFRSKAEERQILDQLKSGRLDIVVGTHRLLQKDVKFKQLGLLVVDEEHRFGVKDKERIKKAREMVDVLTLTATPIPRTLNMALSGLRDMSIIATPPTERLAVRTLVSRISDDVMRDAIDQELKRGGQVYLVHNRVEGIYRLAEHVERLVPRAKVLVGHGQMNEKELEKVMLAFMAGDADVLVCTTIIESGLDIPRANTMLIHRADQLGLAQLYQLRGRVGRSNQRAYCYLLIPEPKNLVGLAEKRVAAMQRYTELGSGFQIATMDMEIRGAGNLLGKGQSGHVKEVGLDMFCELLAESVTRLKEGGEAPPPRVSCEMKVGVPAFLPEDYVPDVNLRLFFYKRIASSRSREELEDAFEDLADRCGPPPEQAQNLFEVTSLKIAAQRLGARSFTYNRGGMVVALDPVSRLAGQPVITLVQKPSTRWKLTPQVELVRKISDAEWERGLPSAWEALRELTNFAEGRDLLLPE